MATLENGKYQLEAGDVIYEHDNNRRVYKHHIVRTTKTQAITKNGTKIKRVSFGTKTFSFAHIGGDVWHPKEFNLESDEEVQAHIKFMNFVCVENFISKLYNSNDFKKKEEVYKAFIASKK